MVEKKKAEPILVKRKQPVQVGRSAAGCAHDKYRPTDFGFPVRGIKHFIQQAGEQGEEGQNKKNQHHRHHHKEAAEAEVFEVFYNNDLKNSEVKAVNGRKHVEAILPCHENLLRQNFLFQTNLQYINAGRLVTQIEYETAA